MTTKTYFGPDGAQVERYLAVDHRGNLKSGFRIAIQTIAADSFSGPNARTVHDDKAHDGYVGRMRTPNRKKKADNAEAVDDTEQTHDGYIDRMKRRKPKPAADTADSVDDKAHAGYLQRMKRDS